MEYVVGSVAALISGNVTPNRPKLIKRALTPTKHQPSPNVTPKSGFVDDRSIFLSPTLQKKKAIVKKSPKRIFENPDLDVTGDGDGDSTITSPKADKVKKHLKDDLEADTMVNTSLKSPKKSKGKLNKSVEPSTPKKKIKTDEDETANALNVQTANESTPTKKKKKRDSISTLVEEEKSDKENSINNESTIEMTTKSSKKKHKSQTVSENDDQNEVNINNEDNLESPKKKKKHKKSQSQESTEEIIKNEIEIAAENKNESKKKKNKKHKKNKSKSQNKETTNENNNDNIENQIESPKKKAKTNIVNPNAITNKDSDSEHESDNEIESETEQTNKEILDTNAAEESSEDEETEVKKPGKKEKKERNEIGNENTEEELKRTLFVGNVPFSKKCKKEIKKIFDKYGAIETVRIRTVPVKDARVTPKLAVIKNELHPDRSTVNVYVKFKDASSVDKGLAENNTVLNDHHLRVTRSEDTGAHDSNRAIFVGNLPFALEDDVLRAKFEKCGAIDSVRIIRDRKTNAGKGFGYVNFASKDGVELALSMTEEDLTMKNRIIRVKRCTFNQRQGKKEQGNGQGERQRGQKGKPVKPEGDGAYRRIMKKRQNEEGGGPPEKRARNIQQPGGGKEKKARKEFVGMTAEKKKKHKFNKGQKKKRALSEILTKHRKD